MYKLLYTETKKSYIDLQNTSIIQHGGKEEKITEETYQQSKFHNLYYYFDKGSDNLWTEEVDKRDRIDGIEITRTTPEEFDKFLTKTMAARYHARLDGLKNLMNLMKIGDDTVTNLDFLDKFYHYMFKGTAFKKYFADEKLITDDIKRRYKIFTEFVEGQNSEELPKKRYFIFADNPNPCHLIKIMKDEFGRVDKDSSGGSPVKYGFVNIKELGRGAAGTASLFGYHINENDKLKIAAKLMASNQFSLTNGGQYLPLEIGYVSSTHQADSTYYKESGSTFKEYRNTRFLYTNTLADYIDSYYPGFSKYNVFDVENNKLYPKVLLSVSSDNFTNQTIMHMILEMILTDEFYKKHGLDKNFIKQYDAMLCYNTSSEFKEGQSWLQYLKGNASAAFDYVGKKLSLINPSIDGLNFMEVADAGDLHGHMFDVHKNKFPHIKSVSDFTGDNFKSVDQFLSKMIKDLLRPLSVLQHPKYAFVHGDMKSKNIFVKKGENEDEFIYKLADYDKSSINFNGVRFYNSGNKLVKKIMNTFGPSRYDNYRFGKQTKYARMVVSSVDVSNEAELEKTIENATKDSTVSTYSSINAILEDDGLVYNAANIGKEISYDERVSIIYAYIITQIKEGRVQSILDEVSELEKNKSHAKIRKDMMSLMISALIYINKHHKINIEIKKIETIADFIAAANKIIKENKNVNFNIFYRLTSLPTYASIFFSSLQKVELEQLNVRYTPFPFFHTIDLYTLFLSLLQSPLVLTFLQYCIANKNNNMVQQSIFWNSFYDLWVDDSDIYTILGYFDFIFEGATIVDVNEMASIGFILDPIKKNNIYLVRSVSDAYWERVWENNEYKNIKDHIENMAHPASHKIRLSADQRFSVTMPNIALSKCGNFSQRLHRDGKSYYVNENIVVYGAPGTIEKLQKLWKGPYAKYIDPMKKDIIATYKKNLFTALHSYVEKNKANILGSNIKVKGFKQDDRLEQPELETYAVIPLTKEETADYIISTPDSADHQEIREKVSAEIPAVIIDDLIDPIQKVVIMDTGAGWFSKKEWNITDFIKSDVSLVLNAGEIDDVLKNTIIAAAGDKGTYGLAKNSQQLHGVIENILKNRAINGNLKNKRGSKAFKQKLGEYDEQYKKKFEEYAKNKEVEYRSLNTTYNMRKKEEIDQKNKKIRGEFEEAKRLKTGSKQEMYNKMLENLKNYGFTGLDKYISERCRVHGAGAFKTMYNVCKTNTYKDMFYSVQNWDYCDITVNELNYILENYRLF